MALSCALACVLACQADVTTTCVGGDGSCDTHQLGGEIPAGDCFEGCDTVNPSGRTGEFPCAVEVIMQNCRRCHTADMPLEPEAPFDLDTYEQSQGVFAGTAIWARMKAVVEIDFMPRQAPKLTAEEKTQLIDEWVCECAPPRDEMETCM